MLKLTYWTHNLTLSPHKVKLARSEPSAFRSLSEVLGSVMIPVGNVHVQKYVRVIAASRTGYNNPFVEFNQLIWSGPEDILLTYNTYIT